MPNQMMWNFQSNIGVVTLIVIHIIRAMVFYATFKNISVKIMAE